MIMDTPNPVTSVLGTQGLVDDVVYDFEESVLLQTAKAAGIPTEMMKLLTRLPGARNELVAESLAAVNGRITVEPEVPVFDHPSTVALYLGDKLALVTVVKVLDYITSAGNEDAVMQRFHELEDE